MARIAYILLCHKDPDAVVAQARRITAVGDFVSIHFDARAPRADFARIQEPLEDDPRVCFARRRVRCGWGAWSLVEATLLALEAALESFPRATHVYMISGDCMPIKSAAHIRARLDADGRDICEGHDFFTSDWIRTGLKEERLIYRHHFNERTQSRLFYGALSAQRALGLTRTLPGDLRVRIGSQWWCLRRSTAEAVLSFARSRRDVVRFFSTTWIPDETFFQTLVWHLIPSAEIDNRTPTFLIFSDYGMPVSFYDDHAAFLLGQDYMFARKISPGAMELKARLGEVYADGGRDFPLSGEGRRLYDFLVSRGRAGRRFAPRFWEREATLGRERELLIVACKKWHVAKRLVERAGDALSVPVTGYLFDEADARLPDLGGIETTLTKRLRHRRALLRMLYDYHGSDKLVICLDTKDLDIMLDMASDRATVRVLEVECDFSDDYLMGHARRVGLAGEATPAESFERLLPTIRADIRFEAEGIRDAGLEHVYRLREGAGHDDNAGAIAAFLDIDAETARRIVSIDYLFAD